ncbi:MAG: glycoside hydrolase [Alistipes sp.]|nr:glycoside hydrolase [Alistipes sp.]
MNNRNLMWTLLLVFACVWMFMPRGGSQPQIITTADEIADGEWQCFRRQFFLPYNGKAELRIAADTKYWLYVNGELVVREGGLKRGPTPTGTYCDVIDVPNLHFGENTIAVLVQYYGRNSFSHRPTATPGLWFSLDTPLRNIVSDSDWQAIRYDAFWAPEDENPKGAKQYRLAGANVGYDARRAVDFAADDFDCSQWPQAVVVERSASDWGEFVERPIPHWRWTELLSYRNVSRNEEGAVVGKLPHNAHVTPYIKLKAKGGERIVICTDDYWIGPARSFRTEYIAKEGVQEFETPIWTNGHEVLYFLPEGVEVLDVKYRESGYDSDFVGMFGADDAFYSKLWQKSARTLYVTMRDNYMDCPDRERAQWWGDVVNELGEAGYLFDERAHLLTRKAILELMNWQQPDGVIASPVPGWYNKELPCQMLASVGYYGFWTYYMLTGDKATIEEIYPRVRKYVVEVWNPQNTGLVNVRRGGWHWGDWGKNIDKEALQQCWYALALKGMANMAELIGKGSDKLYAEQMYDKLYHGFNEKYWNEERQMYVSKRYKDSPDDRVQAMAVVAGLVPAERYPAMCDFLKKHYNASPYMEKYVLEALCMMDQHSQALERMKHRFGEMVAAPHTTLWEGWEYTGARGMTYKPGNGTYNHAWSGGGLTILSQYIAGIEPLTPCFERFRVEPNLGTINKLQCRVPTRFGAPIELAAIRDKGSLRCLVTVPAGTVAQIDLPKEFSSIEFDGQFLQTLELGEGVHTVVYRP